MLFIKSLIFNILYILITAIFSVIIICITFMPTKFVLFVVSIWAKILLFLLRIICGIKIVVEDKYGILKRKDTFIVASKHQSALETIYFYMLFKGPACIVKRELCFIPIFGLIVWKLHIPIRRGSKNSLNDIFRFMPKALENGRNVVIFPEGTRKPYGKISEQKDYKSGIYHIANQFKNYDVVPVSLNSGKFWGKKSFIKKPGTVIIKIKEPLDSSLINDKIKFMAALKDAIEDDSI